MTGFPGETEGEFAETVRFIEQQPFTYLHVFTYSERPGTAAATLPDSVTVETRRERTRILRALSDKKNAEFRRRMIGKTLSAVTLEERGMAMSSNFLKIRMTTPREPNQMVQLTIGSNSRRNIARTRAIADSCSVAARDTKEAVASQLNDDSPAGTYTQVAACQGDLQAARERAAATGRNPCRPG